ncbi:adenylate kinase [Leptolyngbya sp. NIES-3755]|nr:adenylate kinase [Leptolyngbya sp. NIES-3755]
MIDSIISHRKHRAKRSQFQKFPCFSHSSSIVLSYKNQRVRLAQLLMAQRTMTMQFILLGLEPKTVDRQALILSERLGIPQISMQRLFSRFMRDRLSEELQAIQQPDALTSQEAVKLAMLEVRLRQPDARQGWILTDFPTCVTQAKSLNLFLEYMGYPQVRAIHLTRSHSPELSAIVEYYQMLNCLIPIDVETTAQITQEIIDEYLQIATYVSCSQQ